MRRIPLLLALCFCCFVEAASAQVNGRLQIHFMDVGQGDGAVLISPLGEVFLFDDGVNNQCEKPVSYLTQLGITKIDYLIVSHYHADIEGVRDKCSVTFPYRNSLSIEAGATIGLWLPGTASRQVESSFQPRKYLDVHCHTRCSS